MGLLHSSDNGATEIPGTSNDSLFVFLAGPIRNWWKPGVEGSAAHKNYTKMRELAHRTLSEETLVYAPNRAWRGPWDDRAQHINDEAVRQCDAFVWLRVDGVLAHGTDEELALAIKHRKPHFMLECNNLIDFGNDLYSLMVCLIGMRNE